MIRECHMAILVYGHMSAMVYMRSPGSNVVHQGHMTILVYMRSHDNIGVHVHCTRDHMSHVIDT